MVDYNKERDTLIGSDLFARWSSTLAAESIRACRRGLHVCLQSNRFGVIKRTSFHEDDRAGHDKQESLYCWNPDT